MEDGSVGVYAHVPFCERVCPYCDFAVLAARPLTSGLETRYVDALLAELEQRRPAFAGRALSSLYLGGGTPSLLQPASVERLIDAVTRAFGADGRPEITLEANPSSVERARLPAFRAAGVNRLSVGIQSFDDGVLRRLGRAHRAEQGRATLDAARAADFASLSLDLIFSAPGQTREAYGGDLDEALRFAPDHVSAYELTVEEGTPYATAFRRGQLRAPAEEDALWMMERTAERLEAAGLQAYEISAFARTGHESRHNRRYWERRPVLGLGMGAWSMEPPQPGAAYGLRRTNPRKLATYLDGVEGGLNTLDRSAEIFDGPTARGEAVFLALRTVRGLDAGRFEAEFGAPPRCFFAGEIDDLCGAGLLLEAPDGGLRLTPRGRLLSDSAFERFV